MNYIMTHYMELLANNQPWNLVFFMVIPVICAEMLAITELIVLYTRNMKGKARALSRMTGIFSGIYFTLIFAYLLLNVVIPLTAMGEWRGVIDILAVGFYMLGVVPFVGIALFEFNLVGKGRNDNNRLKLHAQLVGFYLVSVHIALVFGMLNPHIFLFFE